MSQRTVERRRRPPREEAPWIPKTILGKQVASGEITSLEEILLFIGRLLSSLKKSIAVVRKGVSRPTLVKPKSPLRVRGAGEEKEEAKKREPVEKPALELGTKLVTSLPAEEQIWEYPPISLLADAVSGKADRGDIKANAAVIEKTLESFILSFYEVSEKKE